MNMAAYFRIVQAHWASTAMDGEGARLYGGRWNPPGLSAVYLAESRALAALEILVHAPREALRLEWRMIEVEVPENWVETLNPGNLPADWQGRPSSSGAQHLGRKWLLERSHLALKLPSVIVPEERSLLLNPLHPLMRDLRISEPRKFEFDPRI